MTIPQTLQLALQHHEAGRLPQAEALYREVLAKQPDNIHALHMLGVLASQTNHHDIAVTLIERALEIDPNFAEAHMNLGAAFADLGRPHEALAQYEHALRLTPNSHRLISNIGSAKHMLGEFDEAIQFYERALALDPSHAESHWNRGQILLMRGEFERGLPELEWRFQLQAARPFARQTPQPRWNGEDLRDRTILLDAEQGFGDTIHFIRYASLLAKRGARVIVSCPPALGRLIQTVDGVDEVITDPTQTPMFDFHAPLMSLPAIFGTTLATIPSQVPYVRAVPADIEKWRAKFPGDSKSLKVGLAWAGSAIHTNDRNRSIPPSLLAPLMQIANVKFYSLQKEAPPNDLKLIDWTSELKDFADTAALIANLDLVVTVDTAVAHLAGAMGKPTWTLLPFVPDWRWMLDREDSPWYPTMRLFRQGESRDWPSVVARVARELSSFQ